MARTRKDLTGQRFGRWLVDALAEVQHSGAYWSCTCTCGNRKDIRGAALLAGKSASCGCFARENARDIATTHGQTDTSLYHIWCGMRARCSKPTDPAYANYGGRGITVCKRWGSSFEAFASDVGPRPEGMQLERVKNHLGYSPSNCEWRTAQENSRNRRNNRLVIFEGKRMTLIEASERSGLPYATLWRRLEAGWPSPKLFTPLRGP